MVIIMETCFIKVHNFLVEDRVMLVFFYIGFYIFHIRLLYIRRNRNEKNAYYCNIDLL